MKRILLVTTSFTGEEPGSEAAGSFIEDFAAILALHASIVVVAPGMRGRERKEKGYTVRRFSVNRLPLSLLNLKNPLDWLAIISTLRAGHKTCESVIREFEPDHILALWALPSGYWAHSLGKKYGIGYSVWVLGSDMWSLSGVPLVANILRKVLRDASYRYADGWRLCQDVIQVCGKSADFLPSSRLLPKVRQKQEMLNRNGCRLAFLGRWHKNKGIDLLLGALELLEDNDWKMIDEIRIFGGGPLEETVLDSVRKLCGKHRPVVTGGYLGKKAAAELLSWTDYLIISSRIESIPVVFSDAMKAGCPVIVTPVGDLPQIIKTYNSGLICKGVDPEDIRDSIKLAVRMEPKKFYQGIRKARELFNLEKAAEQIIHRMEDLCE